MKETTGRCAILFPHGVLFRDEEREMRERIAAADVIEAIIGLGPNLFYNSPMEACVVVCRSKKTTSREGRVLFIDAVNDVTRERAQSFLTPANIDRIVRSYNSFHAEPGFAATATLAEIAANDSNLSIPLYVKRGGGAGISTNLPESLLAWRDSSSEFRAAASELFELFAPEEVSP
jgi:type I restriction enzyme M protein